ncbi:CLUMA_CG000636, isoform A [Clunio marinus]|uniref:CLUMA_CG000636, isoform A n=1 Tax=Clunio marinus TaxID=568069 RepID=A0A1J1HFK8_9DIPT|nr:CLUMA_CG000636, isoform A [Clunio marinus]
MCTISQLGKTTTDLFFNLFHSMVAAVVAYVRLSSDPVASICAVKVKTTISEFDTEASHLES